MILGRRFATTISACGILVAFASARAEAAEKLQFNRDIRPILSDHCFRCHGFDKSARQADLRLDVAEGAFAEREGGIKPIVPCKPEESELLRRVTTDNSDERMPPPDAHQEMTPGAIEMVRRWIAEGAEYQPHWAFIKPVRPLLPLIRGQESATHPVGALIRNPIDAFIVDRLRREHLDMSPEADKVTLLRRVTLDLTGLPPTLPEIDAFLADTSPDAYETAVDRLLASPHYGEQMALPWLDAARYADSNGFQQDGDTYQYVWRDWVLRALNANMPFDRFTVEQLSGDLLPDATDEQRLATGFNRCHMLNGEGGAIDEEQRNVILHDRVDVTSTTWLGLTMTCSQCHDHKYDPITQKDYYQLFAFFNNVPESGRPPFGGQYRIADPWMYSGTVEDNKRIREFESQIAAAKEELKRLEQSTEMASAQSDWEASLAGDPGDPPQFGPWFSIGPYTARSFSAAYEKAYEPEREIDFQKSYQNGSLRWAPHPEWEDGKSHELEGEDTAIYLCRTIHAAAELPATLSFGSDDAIKVWLNGERVLAKKVTRGVEPDQEKVVVTLAAGKNTLLVKIVNGAGIGGFYFNLLDFGLPRDIQAIASTKPEARSSADADKLRAFFVKSHPSPALREVQKREQSLQMELDAALAARPRVMIMSEAQPRKTHILTRGNYEMPADEVTAATPAAFPPLPQGAPNNRLGLAQWLVSAENPLTARVQVNRYWQLFFGKGLVKTSENLGLQSDQPTHPELLDWLAVEFRESGWNVKQMHRLIVTSATYRQSSRVTPELLARDPENRLFARGARFRLSSLTLRDVALAASGLLNSRIGGKPVYPYQPQDIWDGLSITKERDFTYPLSKGDDLFRRSLYTFWRRTVAPGNMFDASVRNTCKVRPSITCTPLHALTTLNDVTWVEASRALAERVMKESSVDPDVRLGEAFRRVCARQPAGDELAVLRRSLDRALAEYRAKPQAAVEYLSHGSSPRDATLDSAEHAAYATVCLAIFNLDEALTRE